MNELISQLNDIDRRSFLAASAKAALGVSVWSGFNSAIQAAPANGVKAKRLVYLFMAGAMSHLDTFDLKPGHKNQGLTKSIATNVAGMQVSHYLPLLSRHFDKLAVIRSVNTPTGAHLPGEYLMRTSYEQIATTQHPTIGPWIQRLNGRQNKTLPDTVLISTPVRHPGSGYLGPSFSPLPIGDPNRGLENTKSPADVAKNVFDKRMSLVDRLNRKFREKFKSKDVQAYADFYNEATSLLSSDELKAFDLNLESQSDRDRYGRNQFGQGCLLARRMIENNVRCVEVSFGGWDHHRDIYSGDILPARTRVMDRAVSHLLTDLSARGLLDETLVVLATEFGRSPVMNQNAGRDHHPSAYSVCLAGGGVSGGRYYGKSDAAGHGVEEDGVLPADLNATIATALGLPLDQEIVSPTGRPFKVAHDGQPLLKIL
jgi:hypothetical protein